MTETKWLSEDEREAWLALVSIMFRLPGRVENQLRTEEDMSLAEYLVLAMLSEAPEHRGSRVSALAAATNTSQSRLSRIVARMERDSLVTREGRQDDRRVVVGERPPGGPRARQGGRAQAHVRHVREMVFDRLSTEQVAQLREIGRALNCGANARSVLGLD